MPSRPRSRRRIRPSLAWVLVVGLAGLFFWPREGWSQTEVDLELVLAVDASGSVDDREFALQMGGIAAGFRDPAVQEAIVRAPLGRIAVTVAIWAEANRPKYAMPWRVIASPEEAEAFADLVERTPRTIPSGGTGIGKAIYFALTQIRDNRFEATRRVIDLSGDGSETAPREWTVLAQQAQQAARAFDVTVNALAILNEEPALDRYYRRYVNVGFGAFTMVAADYEDLAEAMRRKLLREIRYEPEVSEAGRSEVSRAGPAEN